MRYEQNHLVSSGKGLLLSNGLSRGVPSTAFSQDAAVHENRNIIIGRAVHQWWAKLPPQPPLSGEAEAHAAPALRIAPCARRVVAKLIFLWEAAADGAGEAWGTAGEDLVLGPGNAANGWFALCGCADRPRCCPPGSAPASAVVALPAGFRLAAWLARPAAGADGIAAAIADARAAAKDRAPAHATQGGGAASAAGPEPAPASSGGARPALAAAGAAAAERGCRHCAWTARAPALAGAPCPYCAPPPAAPPAAGRAAAAAPSPAAGAAAAPAAAPKGPFAAPLTRRQARDKARGS